MGEIRVFDFTAALALAALLASAAVAQDGIRDVQVAFPAGATGTSIRDSISGYESVSYRLGAEAGQWMGIGLSASTNQTFFTVFAPGSGPGQAGLAASEVTGPMVPEVNVFGATLPASGVYTVNVYQMRNAARAGLRSDYTIDFTIRGETGAVVQGDYADGLQGGPDFYEVRTRTGSGALNIRAAPTTGAAVVTAVTGGTLLRNLGCRMNEGRRWCRVATLADPGVEGWAAGDFLFESGGVATHLPDMIPVPDSPADALVPGTNFHATGQIACVRDSDAPAAMCNFGVVREGGGSGSVTVFWPEGGSRMIFFEGGTPVYYDQSQADRGAEMAVTRQGDNSIVFVGQERFEIPDAVIFGG